jgi:hypothetical protein
MGIIDPTGGPASTKEKPYPNNAFVMPFLDSFYRGCERLGFRFAEDLVHYTTRVFEGFVTDHEKRANEPLGLRLLENMAGVCRPESMPLKDIADTALFLTGAFPEAPDEGMRKHVIKVGRTAYGALSYSHTPRKRLFGEMSNNFEPLSDVVNYISQDGAVASGDVVRMWKAYEKSRNQTVRKVLSMELQKQNVIISDSPRVLF